MGGRSGLRPSFPLENRIRENRIRVPEVAREKSLVPLLGASMTLLKPSAVALVTGSRMEVRRLGR
jgi:hypothetical protein